ncbi:MAG TPA: hypothetical protein VN829_03245 [Dongiaceae bacterium]|nr:hypothetical protein [Dongiaceae bacterium]
MTDKPIVVVLPVSMADFHLAVKWLKWAAILGGTRKIAALVSPRLTAKECTTLLDAARPMDFTLNLAEINDTGYWGAPNQMFKAALELMAKEFPGSPMLWAEADTVPMHAGWLQEIEAEYAACGKPFLGQKITDAIGFEYLTGTAVYPPDCLKYPTFAALPGPDTLKGWDSQCAADTVPNAAESVTIRQVWRPPVFTSANIDDIVPKGCALFHQCKDATLIDALCARGKIPQWPTGPQLEKSTYGDPAPYAGGVTSGGRVFARELNVELLFVTFKRDMEFLKYTLPAAYKYAKGFRGITLAVPRTEKGLYDWTSGSCKIVYFDEAPGKGMLSHEVAVCRADELCPTADAILHIDADFCCWRKFTPEDVAPKGKPLLVAEYYENCGKRNPNRLHWQTAVENAVGFRPEREGMTRHPAIHLREVYKMARTLVQDHTGKKFDEYVLGCRNEFPQGFAELPLLAAVAIKHYPALYTVQDYDHSKDRDECCIGHDAFQYIYKRDRDIGCEVWSHGGIQRYRADLTNWLQGQVPAYYVK